MRVDRSALARLIDSAGSILRAGLLSGESDSALLVGLSLLYGLGGGGGRLDEGRVAVVPDGGGGRRESGAKRRDEEMRKDARYIRRSASLNNVDVQCVLGALLFRGCCQPDVIPKDRKAAVQWFERAFRSANESATGKAGGELGGDCNGRMSHFLLGRVYYEGTDTTKRSERPTTIGPDTAGEENDEVMREPERLFELSAGRGRWDRHEKKEDVNTEYRIIPEAIHHLALMREYDLLPLDSGDNDDKISCRRRR